jgi:hypothetical protein
MTRMQQLICGGMLLLAAIFKGSRQSTFFLVSRFPELRDCSLIELH